MCCRPAQPISASSESSSRVAVFQCTAAHTRKTQVILTDSSAGELDWHPNRCRPGATMPCSTVEGLSTKRNTMARARRHKSERPLGRCAELAPQTLPPRSDGAVQYRGRAVDEREHTGQSAQAQVRTTDAAEESGGDAEAASC